ncbi:MAG: hypothetical protein WB626_06040 [Bacteroidota bacterium]
MRKRDPIFWCAAGIFLLALILAGVTQQQLWLFLMAGSYLLRPTLASLGVGRRFTDERQMSLQYRSGNIAFAVMIITGIVQAVYHNLRNDPSWEMFNIIVVLGLASKALFNVVFGGNRREGAARIIMTVGLLVVLFVALENGFTAGGLIEAAPWLAIVGIGWLAGKFPRTIGGIVLAAAAVLLFFILARGITLAQLATALVVAVPLALAGIFLLAGDRDREAAG